MEKFVINLLTNAEFHGKRNRLLFLHVGNIGFSFRLSLIDNLGKDVSDDCKMTQKLIVLQNSSPISLSLTLLIQVKIKQSISKFSAKN